MARALLTLIMLLVPSWAWATFPTTGLLDDFNRANENPLSTAGGWGSPIFSGTGSFKLQSNALMDDSLADGGGSAMAYRNTATYGPGVEVYATLTTLWQATGSDFWFWLNGNAEGTAGLDGYQVYWFWSSGTTWTYRIYRVTDGVQVQIGTDNTMTLVSGDALGVEIISGVITPYHKPAAGSWTAKVSQTDSTYTSGHIGFSKGFSDTTSVIDDFHGGTIPPPGGSETTGLRESSSNPRYFENAAGQIVYLVGGYYGCELQDQCFGIAAEGSSDWAGVIADMQSYNGNLVRMWVSEGGGSSVPNAVAPMPWNRSGTAGAPSGNKWDLSSLDIGNLTTPALNSTHYFERLLARVQDANNRGIYVSVMLFHRFGWESDFGAAGHPFLSANNINSVNGDTNADGDLYELAAVGGPGASFQLAYVDQVVDTLQNMNNVLFEICNECYDTAGSNAWQESIVARIHAREASRPIKHPVGFSAVSFFPSGGAGSPTAPTTSASEWYNIGDASYATTPPSTSTPKPSLLDSDHITGCPSISDNDWPWKTFTRGHNIWHIYCTADHAPSAGEQVILARMGQTRTYAERMNLKTAVPSTTACATQYALIGPTELLCFIPGGGATSVTLTTPGDYRVEWFDPTTAATSVDAATIAHGTRTVTPPFGGDAVVYLTLQVTAPPVGQVTIGATSSNSCFTCTSLTFTHTVGAGNDRALYVAAHTVANTISTLTVDGAAATRLGTVTSGVCVLGQYACVSELWMVIGPSVGAHTVVITAAGQGNISGGGLSLFGVHQTTPTGPGSLQSATGVGDFPTVTVSSTSGGLVLGVVTMNHGGGTMSGRPGTTVVYANPDAAGFAKIGFGHSAGTTTTAIGFSNADTQPFAILAVPVLPSSTSTAFELLLWNDNSLTETLFRLQWKHAAQPSYSDLVTLGQNTTSYQVGYSTEVSRCYRIRAENSGGNSAFSNELCAAVTAAGPIVLPLFRPTLGGGLSDE